MSINLKNTIVDLREVASQQGGLFTRSQAHRAGLDGKTLERWIDRGWICLARRSVYLFAGVPSSRWHPAVSAALAIGPHAVLSHRTAAAIHNFPGLLLPAEPELVVPPTPHRRLEGVSVHRTGPVDPRDTVYRRGVAVTAPAQTLVDMACTLNPSLLGSILDEGAVTRLWTFQEVAACLDRQPRRRIGSSTLRHLLALRLGEATPDSPLEQRIIRYLWPLGPFEVHYQLLLEGIVAVLDVAWPWWRVAAEIDGRSYRQTSRTAHDRESRKLTLLAAAEWKVAHLTATMSAEECVEAVTSLIPADPPPR